MQHWQTSILHSNFVCINPSFQGLASPSSIQNPALRAVNMGSSEKAFKVGVICGSTRSPRAGAQITDFVYKAIGAHINSHSSGLSPPISLDFVDIAAFNLPIYDEPGIPQAITDPNEYAHQHTRDWSARIAPLDAFVFVTPQYNWGIPAALKNAIDYLFNEWKGKPGMVVSYGGHGGGKAAAALTTVLQGLRMQPVEKTVNLMFPDSEFSKKCYAGNYLALGVEENEVWAKDRDDIVAVWDEMVGKLTAAASH